MAPPAIFSSIASSLSNLKLRKPEGMASLAPRRFYHLVGIWLAVAFFLVVGHSYLTGSGLVSNWQLPFVAGDGSTGFRKIPDTVHERNQLKVAILEAAGVHDEVVSALIHAFGGQKHVNLRMYQKNSRYNMDAIVKEFELASPIIDTQKSWDIEKDIIHDPPHVVVSTTCELDTKMRKAAFTALLEKSNAYLFCLCHHADQWDEGINVDWARKFAAKNRLDMITLSNHTGEFLAENGVSKWGEDGRNVKIRVLPPVFPAGTLGPKDGEINLAMQGDYASERRDYIGIFKDFDSVIARAKKLGATDDVTLHLVGHGKHPAVPDNIKERVTFDESLSYPEFYSILSSSYAVLPAFATEEYFDRKASSTVPASIIAGAPLIATEELLEAYTYLPREAAWVVKHGETELATVRRIIGDQYEFEKKRWLVADLREKLLKENVENVHQWIVEGLRKV